MRFCNSLSLIHNGLFKSLSYLLSTLNLLQTTTYQLPTFLTVKCLAVNKLSSALLTKLFYKYEDEYFPEEYSVDFSINYTINYTGGHFCPLVISSMCGAWCYGRRFGSLTGVHYCVRKAP